MGNENNVKLRFLKIRNKKFFCFSSKCHMTINGKILFMDHHHLNINGSKFVGRRIVVDNPDLLDGTNW